MRSVLRLRHVRNSNLPQKKDAQHQIEKLANSFLSPPSYEDSLKEYNNFLKNPTSGSQFYHSFIQKDLQNLRKESGKNENFQQRASTAMIALTASAIGFFIYQLIQTIKNTSEEDLTFSSLMYLIYIKVVKFHSMSYLPYPINIDHLQLLSSSKATALDVLIYLNLLKISNDEMTDIVVKAMGNCPKLYVPLILNLIETHREGIIKRLKSKDEGAIKALKNILTLRTRDNFNFQFLETEINIMLEKYANENRIETKKIDLPIRNIHFTPDLEEYRKNLLDRLRSSPIETLNTL